MTITEPEHQQERPAPHPPFQIHSAGCCDPNPGRGGWSAIVLKDGRRINVLSGMDHSSTVARMELTAAIEGLSAVPKGAVVEVVTDSRYVVDGAVSYIERWARDGFWGLKNVDL
jgi:ribonuclease HI